MAEGVPHRDRSVTASVSVDLDPIDVHLRGYGHVGEPADVLVYERALDRLLEAFERHRVRATFFVLARDVPSELGRLRDITAAGHEIASHGIDHLPAIASRPDVVIRRELEESRQRLESAVGCRVQGFRAPDWSAGSHLIAQLAAAGYRYDASLVPTPILTAGRFALALLARSARDAMAVRLPPSFHRQPFEWRVGASSVIEFPLAVSPRLRIPLYHTLRPSLSDSSFRRHLDGFVARGESFSYALHGVDALGLVEDGVDARLRVHPGMAAGLDAKLALLDRTLADIASRFDSSTFAERIASMPDPAFGPAQGDRI